MTGYLGSIKSWHPILKTTRAASMLSPQVTEEDLRSNHSYQTCQVRLAMSYVSQLAARKVITLSNWPSIVNIQRLLLRLIRTRSNSLKQKMMPSILSRLIKSLHKISFLNMTSKTRSERCSQKSTSLLKPRYKTKSFSTIKSTLRSTVCSLRFFWLPKYGAQLIRIMKKIYSICLAMYTQPRIWRPFTMVKTMIGLIKRSRTCSQMCTPQLCCRTRTWL